jgi:CBS domain-containing protein
VPTRSDSRAHKAELSVPLLKRVKVADFMKSDVFTATPDFSIEAIVALMKSKKIDAVPILEGGNLVGIIASRDIAMISRKRWPETLAGDIMTKQIIVGYKSESLHEALGRMTQNNISHLPIVDQRRPGKITGILTIKDVALSYEQYKEDEDD